MHHLRSSEQHPSALRPLYRGYMTQPAQSADGERFVITMAAENYLLLLSGPQRRLVRQGQVVALHLDAELVHVMPVRGH